MLLSNFYYLITLLSLSTTVTCSEEKMISRKLRNSVVVIGSGAAGLASAIEASNAGSMVYLLEKMSNVGGNSAKASSGINGCLTSVQRTRNVNDTVALFKADTMRTAAGRALEPLVDKLTLESADAIEFLISLGLPLTDLIQLGGHSSKRTHRLSTHAPIGFSLVKLLHSHAAQRDNIQILTSTTVTSLLWEQIGTERRITGITYRSDGADEDTTLPAEAVVLASGGSAFDQSEDGLMSEFAPHVRGMATSSGSQADGSGIKLAREVGVDLINMDKVQVHPTGFVDPQNPSQMSKILAPEALRGSGGILVNRQGQRFANELGSRGYLSQSIFNHSSAHSVLLESGREQITAYMILNTEAVEAFGPSAIAFYVKRGLVKEFSNLDSLCADLGLPRDELLNTLQKYVASAESGTTDEFGKSVYPTSAFLSDNKLYVAEITPVVHYTLGGVMIDSSASAQWKDSNGDSQTFAGLFAAGESTGGVHGSDRLAGNSLLECIVFGRTAGRNAALVEKRASNNAKEDL